MLTDREKIPDKQQYCIVRHIIVSHFRPSLYKHGLHNKTFFLTTREGGRANLHSTWTNDRLTAKHQQGFLGTSNTGLNDIMSRFVLYVGHQTKHSQRATT